MEFEWDERYRKGIAAMDATHQEFVSIVNQLLECDDAKLADNLKILLQHSRAHFDQENRWMEESAFPPIGIHMDEHQRVLGIIEQLIEQTHAGQINDTRDAIKQLPGWFEQHAASMDNALAMHMKNTGHSATS